MFGAAVEVEPRGRLAGATDVCKLDLVAANLCGQRVLL